MTVAEAKAKLVSTARAEIGYREGAGNYTKYAEDPGIARLYGWKPQNQPWCCTYVNWCFLQAFGYDLGSQLTYGGTAACANSADLFRQAGAFSHFPEVGAQAFFYSGGGINHTGLVVSVDGSTFVTIEGNYSDKVSEVRHNVGNGNVAGFGIPNWSLIEEAKTTNGSKPSTDPKSGETKPKEADSGSTAEPKQDHSWTPALLRTSNTYSRDCVAMQGLLTARKFQCGEADGIFGPKTRAAVIAAQIFYGLEADGVCGPLTWAKLLDFKEGGKET